MELKRTLFFWFPLVAFFFAVLQRPLTMLLTSVGNSAAEAGWGWDWDIYFNQFNYILWFVGVDWEDIPADGYGLCRLLGGVSSIIFCILFLSISGGIFASLWERTHSPNHKPKEPDGYLIRFPNEEARKKGVKYLKHYSSWLVLPDDTHAMRWVAIDGLKQAKVDFEIVVGKENGEPDGKSEETGSHAGKEPSP